METDHDHHHDHDHDHDDDRDDHHGRGITLMVPFRSSTELRTRTWEWLREYWHYHLPDAEIVMGENWDVPFSKTKAVNHAFRRCFGDIVVILDADCYIKSSVVLECARRIRKARDKGDRLWFVPYRHFYRLTEHASRRVLLSDPEHPYEFPSPPHPRDTEPVQGASFGHWFGALIQVMPREAFIAAGEMDERFAGWGGEDVSFMMAVDTLYAKHMTTRNQVLHLWHPHKGIEWDERTWEGQEIPGVNNQLATKYQGARGHPVRMQNLVDGGDGW